MAVCGLNRERNPEHWMVRLERKLPVYLTETSEFLPFMLPKAPKNNTSLLIGYYSEHSKTG